MKRLFVALVMLASVSAFSQTALSIAVTVGQWVYKNTNKVYYVQVEATAEDAEAARQAVFRKAVELAVGTLVLGETESDGRNIIRNDVVTYSSGYVEDFKILKETRVGSQTRMTVDVWVSDSKIANRLTTIGANSGATIDGVKIKREWEIDRARELTDAQRRQDAMRVMNVLLRDYPKLALQPVVKRTWVGKNNGITAFFVEADIKFSEEYILALDEAVALTRQGKFASRGKTAVSIHRGFMYIAGSIGYYDDKSIQDKWADSFQTNVSTKLTFLGAGKPYINCWLDTKETIDGELFGWQDKTTYVVRGGKTVTRKYILENRPQWNISDERFVNWVSKFDKVEAQVVDTASCS
jgi:hypothetical protein